MFFLLVALLQNCQAELVTLGYKNYTQAKKEYSPLIVFYYGDDKQSKKFIDDFIQISANNHSLQKDSSFPSNINFGLVDTVEEKKLMEKTQIGQTPTLMLFYGEQKKLKYSGALNAQAFINWIKKTVRDSPELNEYHPSSLISRWDQLASKFKGFNLVAILVTPEYRTSPLKAFIQAARQMPQGFVFCHIFDTKISRYLNVTQDDSGLVIYNKFEDIETHDQDAQGRWQTFIHHYKGDIKNQDEILKFLKIHSFKKGFVYVDDTKFQKLTRRSDQLPSIFLLYNKTIPEQLKYVEELQQARYPLLNKAILGVIDVNGDCKDRLDRWFQIDVNTTEFPKLIAVKPNGEGQFLKYINKDYDAIEFYEQFTNGKIKPFYKDEGILSQLYDGAGIYKLTRTTYHSYIKEQNAKGIDVVVTFTARKCVPCKDFRVDYNEVYKTYKEQIEGKVVFTRLDIENNEIDGLVIDNYPHVKLYAAGVESPYTLFETRKDENSLRQWLSDKSNYGEIFKKTNSDL
ncbi:hypothetical protein pb186bvf_013563 [Paramecium bursaria]